MRFSSKVLDLTSKGSCLVLKTSSRHAAKRIAELAMGLLAWNAQDYAFDYVLYPLAIWRLGLWHGGFVMSAGSLVGCLLLLRLYDYLGRDWLGIEFVKGQRHYQGPSRWRRRMAWLLSRGDGVAFVVLTFKNDPFITTAYLRRQSYSGMNRRDWVVFLASWVISNTFWILVCFGGLSFLRWLF